MGQKYPDFVKAYTEKYGEGPINAFHAHAYDAAKILAAAIEKVAKTDENGTTYIGKKALHDELFATKGQCGAFNFAVYEFTDGDPATFELGKNPKKIYPTN